MLRAVRPCVVSHRAYVRKHQQNRMILSTCNLILYHIDIGLRVLICVFNSEQCCVEIIS